MISAIRQSALFSNSAIILTGTERAQAKRFMPTLTARPRSGSRSLEPPTAYSRRSTPREFYRPNFFLTNHSTAYGYTHARRAYVRESGARRMIPVWLSPISDRYSLPI